MSTTAAEVALDSDPVAALSEAHSAVPEGSYLSPAYRDPPGSGPHGIEGLGQFSIDSALAGGVPEVLLGEFFNIRRSAVITGTVRSAGSIGEPSEQRVRLTVGAMASAYSELITYEAERQSLRVGWASMSSQLDIEMLSMNRLGSLVDLAAVEFCKSVGESNLDPESEVHLGGQYDRLLGELVQSLLDEARRRESLPPRDEFVDGWIGHHDEDEAAHWEYDESGYERAVFDE